MKQITALYIDLFCGAGGTSSGVEYARLDGRKCAEVVACVNHDANAIRSHKANHPHTLHFTEDIRTLELSPMVKHLEKKRRQYPKAKVVLWASLECTNFSKAKGGQPRDADSRTLADHLFRYIDALQPDYIQIENVEEFMCWGALDENGKPVSRDQGSDYLRWVRQVQAYGYDFDWHVLNAADFGAYTSRKRFFGLFARKGLPIAFPQQTHAKSTTAFASQVEANLFPNQYKPWNPVREVLDLDDDGESIFVRRKPLCEKTLERIYAGLVKFVAGGKKQHETFMLRYNTVRPQDTVKSIEEPCGVVTTENRFAKVKCQFLSKQFSGDPDSKNIDIEQPAGTVTTIDHHALVSSKFITEYYGGANHNHSIEEPATTVTTMGRHAFVTAYYGNGFNSSIDSPAPTVTTKDRISLVSTKFIANEYSGGGQISSIEQPNPAVLTTPKQKIVSAQYLMNPQYQSDGGSIDNPCFTLIARMDKMPPYLITTKEGVVGIAIYESDSPWTRRVKEFMAAYGIVDICMRMLNIGELKRIMGFPTDYVLIGTQAEQKKYIGNAVEVNMSRVLCEALCRKIKSMNQ
jgi:DNA (cytosine-5)-methyltransferase 1